MVLREEQLHELRTIFELFDADGDGLLEPEELSAIFASSGVALTDAEVLDLVTELKPDLRKLPFDEFVNVMCRPMADRPAIEAELAATFPKFAADGSAMTAASLQEAMAGVGRPTDPLLSVEMIREAKSGASGAELRVSHTEFCAMVGIDAAAKATAVGLS